MRGVQHDFAHEALANLDDAAEDELVVETFLESRDRHHLRDGAEAEDLRIPKPLHVLNAPRHELERVGDELVQACERLRAGFGLSELTELSTFECFFQTSCGHHARPST